MIIKNAWFIVLFLFSVSSYAQMHDKYSSKITQVYVNSGGLMLMKVEGVDGFLSLGKVGDKTAEIMYSTALAAKLSNHLNVWVRWYDDTDSYPRVGIINIQ